MKRRPTTSPTLEYVRVRVMRIAEALEDGDVEFARSAVRDLEADLIGSMRPSGATCPVCDLQFDWRGLLERHVSNVHPDYLVDEEGRA